MKHRLIALHKSKGGKILYRNLLNKLKALPLEDRARIVVRSQPFGEIIHSVTHEVFGHIAEIEGGPARIVKNDGKIIAWINAGSDWQFVAIGLCRAAKGKVGWEAALDEAGYL